MAATGMAGTTSGTGADAKSVNMSPFSGPTNSPFDARTITGYTLSVSGNNGSAIYANNATDRSTGALTTGIGFGCGAQRDVVPVRNYGFTDNYTPGLSKPDGTDAANSTFVAIGGGKSTANVNGAAPTVPYVAGFSLQNFGNGGSRNAGAGPIFTGFSEKMVTAAADIATGGVIETGFINRTGAILKSGLNAFGSSTAATAALS